MGDGTTSVVILAGEMLAVAEQFLDAKMHPIVVIQAYRQALEDALDVLNNDLRYINFGVRVSCDCALVVLLYNELNVLYRNSEMYHCSMFMFS